MYQKKPINTIVSNSFLKAFFEDPHKKQRFYTKFIGTYNLPFFRTHYKQKDLILFSPIELKFNNLISFGTSVNEFIKIFGKPNFQKKNDSNTTTLIYKTKISGIRSKCNLIFFNETLVMFNYVFSNIDKKKKNCLLKYSEHKYGNKINANNYQIVDAFNNSLFIIDSSKSLIFNFYTNGKIIKELIDENTEKNVKFLSQDNNYLTRSSS
ncbi:hypothetical protein [Flavicella marina]|uniref:hypothetical protein n=1 Tax=Flavicella marina TaxID=1475951 RepID=UPI001264265A|nr:hypothetical protein [Flavicella marina]